MLTEIYIKSHNSVLGFLKSHYREFDVVLYTNSNYEVPRSFETHSKDLIHFPIDDIDRPTTTKIGPNLDHIGQLLDWAKDKERIVCCCHAGVSRSSATAYLLAAREWGAETGLSVLTRKHWPNRLIVYLGSVVLNNPDIWNTFVKWHTKERNRDPSKDWAAP